MTPRAPVVDTASGAMRGERLPSGLVFRGIPYALPPTGLRRHQPPSPPRPWGGIRDCTRFGNDCLQTRPTMVAGFVGEFGGRQPRSEDALALNVWTPAADGGRRPVMVWIHGGAYMIGGASVPIYDGTAFARDDVVLVSLNYRLHALGFLHLDELIHGASGTGNLAILDQIAALRWVQANIAQFGGDPGNVTIFGESAGAGSVGTMLGTPVADGLYRRAILQSGAASHGLSAQTATRVAARVLDLVGVRPGDGRSLCLVPGPQLVRAAARVFWLESRRLLGQEITYRMTFQPVVDGVTLATRAIERIAAGGARDVDILVGTCADEYRAFVWGLPRPLRGLLPKPRLERYFRGTGRTAADARAVYAERRPGASVRSVTAALEGDQMFTIPAIRLAEAQQRNGGSVHLYRFTWATPIRGGELGACHALDIPFAFDTLGRAGSLWGSSPPQDLATAMHGAWVRFAATGDPNGGDLPQWPRYDLDERPVMEFGTRRRLLRDPGRAERLAWEGVWEPEAAPRVRVM